MKFRLTSAEYAALPDNMKLMYVADGDSYKLPLTDYEDAAEMRRARDREKAEATTARNQAAAAIAELEALKISGGAPKPQDIKTLEASWIKKQEDSQAAAAVRIAAVTKQYHDSLIDTAATALATTLAAKPENIPLLAMHIKTRYEAVQDGDSSTVKIKDKDGKVSAMTTAELSKELIAMPMFGNVVKVSSASGAGGSGGSGSGGPNGGAGGGDKKTFAQMNGAEKSALFKSDANYFNQLAAEDKAAKEAGRFIR